MSDKNLQNLNKLMGAMDTNALSQEEILKHFENIIEFVAQTKDLNRKELEAIRSLYDQFISERKSAETDYAQEFNALKDTLASTIQAKLASLKNGRDGRDGRDGKDGRNGVDGLNGLDGRNGKDGTPGKDGVSAVAGKTGWGAHPLRITNSSGTVIDKVTRAIKFSTNLTTTRSADGVVTVSASGGGSGFTLLPATGTVNGSNKTFTFTQQPTYIISDGAWYRVNVGWTWSVLTATMIIPPNDDIWGFV